MIHQKVEFNKQSPKKKKLLVLSPNPEDATAFYRSAGVFSAMRYPNWDIKINKKDDGVGWIDVAETDVLCFQRPFAAQDRLTAEVALSFGKKIWIDFDDNLVNGVPKSNQFHDVYNDPRTLEIINHMIHRAHVITVSTQAIGDALEVFQAGCKEKTVVIPNAWNDLLFKWDKKKFEPYQNILWRGSKSHHEDLEIHESQIAEAQKLMPDWNWYFVGEPHWSIYRAIPANRLFVVPPMNLVKYFNFMRQLKIGVNIVPLQDTPLSRGRSNIAWIESTLGGAVTVAPDWAEWQRPGITNYQPGGLALGIERASNDMENLYNQSWESLQKLRLSKINHQRFKIMEGLTRA